MPSWQRSSADAPHVSILETSEGLGIHNPAKRSWPLVIFLLVWLCGWGVGEVFAIIGIFGAPLAVQLFLGIWLAFWTIGGATVVAAVMWKVGGSEFIFLTADALVREIRFLGLTWRTVVDLDTISSIDVDSARRRVGQGPGKVRYVADGRTRWFGIDINETDADRAASAVRDYIARRGGPPPAEPVEGGR